MTLVIPEPIVQQMIELYQSGLSLKKVGEIVGKSVTTVKRRLEENGIPRRSSRGSPLKRNDPLTQQIVELYQLGLSCEKVGKIVKLSASAIRNRLEKEGVPRRSLSEAQRKYFCNEDYFEIIDTGPKSCWLGVMASDGNLSSRDLQMSLGLKRTDKNYIIRFKEALEATNPIHDYERTGKDGKTYYSSRITIHSQKMYNDLVAHGVPPRKSLILEPPIGVPDHLVPHWIRGVFDGDGGASFVGRIRKSGTRSVRVSVESTVKVLEFIQEKLGRIGHIYPSSASRAFYLIISKQEDVRKFYDYIYRDAIVYLERKKAIFDFNIDRGLL